MNYKYATLCLLGLSLFGLYSCNNKTKKTEETREIAAAEIQYPLTVDFGSSFQNFKDVKLSEVADGVEFVKLEASPNSLIRRPNTVQVTDSFIFVAQYKSLLQFNRKGKFIRQIGKMGRGPKEYAHIYHACVDRDKERVYVNAGESHKIQTYDFEGKHKGRNKYFSNIEFEMLDSTKVVSFIGNYYGQQKYKLLITGTQKDTLGYLLNTVKFPHQGRTMMITNSYSNRFYRWDNTLNFSTLYGDTVFQIKALDQIKPRYVINKGKYKLPLDSRIERVQNGKKYKQKAANYILTCEHEIENFLLISYQKANYEGDLKLAVYNKLTGELFSVGNSAKKEYGFLNDLNGIGNFIPLDVQDNKYMVSYSSAISLYEENQNRKKEEAEGANSSTITAKHQAFLDSIKMDDNLVVQIVHLK